MTIDNQRLLQYVMYGLGLIVWYVLYRFLAGMVTVTFMVLGRSEPVIPVFQNLGFVMAFVAVGVTAAAVEYSRQHPTASRFGMDVLSELRKVSWPSWKDIKGTTAVVLGVIVVVSVFMFLFDAVFSGLVKVIY
jgi:preprotein translocase SecE subunit